MKIGAETALESIPAEAVALFDRALESKSPVKGEIRPAGFTDIPGALFVPALGAAMNQDVMAVGAELCVVRACKSALRTFHFSRLCPSHPSKF